MADSNEIYYRAFLEGNNKVLQKFLSGKFEIILDKIRGLVYKDHRSSKSVKASSFNNLYIYLTENDAKRLRLYETEGNGDFVTWLSKMATKYYLNERNKERKKQKRHQTSSIEEKAIDPISPTDTALETEEVVNERIEKALSIMSEKKPDLAEIARSLIYLEYNGKNLAKKLGKAEGSIYRLKPEAIEEFKLIYCKLTDNKNEKEIYN